MESKIIGSFKRTNTEPLEANYIFGKYSDLTALYPLTTAPDPSPSTGVHYVSEDTLNLHDGLLKFVVDATDDTDAPTSSSRKNAVYVCYNAGPNGSTGLIKWLWKFLCCIGDATNNGDIVNLYTSGGGGGGGGSLTSAQLLALLLAGTNITLTDTGTKVKIDAAGGGGGGTIAYRGSQTSTATSNTFTDASSEINPLYITNTIKLSGSTATPIDFQLGDNLFTQAAGENGLIDGSYSIWKIVAPATDDSGSPYENTLTVTNNCTPGKVMVIEIPTIDVPAESITYIKVNYDNRAAGEGTVEYLYTIDKNGNIIGGTIASMLIDTQRVTANALSRHEIALQNANLL